MKQWAFALLDLVLWQRYSPVKLAHVYYCFRPIIAGFVFYIGNKVRYMFMDKFAPFPNQMSVIHNIFVKFL